MQGSRHVLEVVVTGGAKEQLAGIAGGMSRVSQQADQMQEALGGSGRKGKKALEDIGEGVKSLTLLEVSEQLEKMAGKLEEFTSRVTNYAKAFTQDIIKEASEFEDAQSSMRFAFGNEWKSVYAEVLKDSAALTFTFKETVDLATSLGRMKINPFGGTTEASQKFLSKTGQNIRALEVLQDTADAVGKGTQDLVISLRNAMSGNWRSLQERFDIPLTNIKKWKQETTKLKTEQEKYNYLVGQLGQMFGGAGREKALNYTKAMAQIPDLLQQIKAGVGLGPEGTTLKIISGAMWDLVDALKVIAMDKDVMSALQAGFRIIAFVISLAVHAGIWFINTMRELIKAAPWLVPLTVGFGVLAVAVGTVAAALLGMTVTIVAVGAALTAISAPLLIAAAIVLPLLIVGFTLLAAAAVPALLFIKAVAGTLSNDFEPGVGVMERLKILFTALWELAQSYNGEVATMSVETAKSVEKAGLMGAVQKIFEFFHRLHIAWNSFSATLDEISDTLRPVILPMLEEFKLLIVEIADAFGINTAAARLAGKDTQSWADSGRSLALVLTDVVAWLIEATREGLHIARATVYWLKMNGVIEFMGDALGVVWTVLKHINIAFKVLGFLLEPITAPIVNLFKQSRAAVEMLINALRLIGRFYTMGPKDMFKDFKWTSLGTVKGPKSETPWQEAWEKTALEPNAPGLSPEALERKRRMGLERAGFAPLKEGEFGPAMSRQMEDSILRRQALGMPGLGPAAGGLDWKDVYAGAPAPTEGKLVPGKEGAGDFENAYRNVFNKPPEAPGAGGMEKAVAQERAAVASEKTAQVTLMQAQTLESIYAHLQKFADLTINMDGEKVGELIAKHHAAVGGTH